MNTDGRITIQKVTQNKCKKPDSFFKEKLRIKNHYSVLKIAIVTYQSLLKHF